MGMVSLAVNVDWLFPGSEDLPTPCSGLEPLLGGPYYFTCDFSSRLTLPQLPETLSAPDSPWLLSLLVL